MKQKYPDLSTVTILRYEEPIEVLVLFKRGSQYSLCHVAGKDVFHSTEHALTTMIFEARAYVSPLAKALE